MIADDVVVLPALSVATAVSVCVPFATLFVFQVYVYGVDVSVVSFVVPSRKNATVAMPDGAADPVPRSVAVAESPTLVFCAKLDPLAGCVIETVGAAASMRISWDLTDSALPT